MLPARRVRGCECGSTAAAAASELQRGTERVGGPGDRGRGAAEGPRAGSPEAARCGRSAVAAALCSYENNGGMAGARSLENFHSLLRGSRFVAWERSYIVRSSAAGSLVDHSTAKRTAGGTKVVKNKMVVTKNYVVTKTYALPLQMKIKALSRF